MNISSNSKLPPNKVFQQKTLPTRLCLVPESEVEKVGAPNPWVSCPLPAPSPWAPHAR